MRTNIDINDDLMAAAMAAGGFKTKREAVEEGLRLVSRRKVYDGLLAMRGQLQWDDSNAGWAGAGGQQVTVQESKSAYQSKPSTRGRGASK
ncbi:MAG: type II toxin-antitoxin system VapB family antitoxin [Betaproteobacteria bacterium]|nr:type II toxin-antitoxin system VapB family antitoxin [Betaproteobacteria bacterium]NBY04905.1 type II toxin-antitoxin system VapB family antitoxin [Betaproteobacteria bacterium]